MTDWARHIELPLVGVRQELVSRQGYSKDRLLHEEEVRLVLHRFQRLKMELGRVCHEDHVVAADLCKRCKVPMHKRARGCVKIIKRTWLHHIRR